jgi:hypothetical protein
MLRRTFLRGLVRQMGSPAMLAATYSNNTEQMATAAVNELQEALVGAPACFVLMPLLPQCWGLQGSEWIASGSQLSLDTHVEPVELVC